MKSIFLGNFYLTSYLSDQSNKQFLGFANDLLQKSYLQGLSKVLGSDNVLALTTPNVRAYPKAGSHLHHSYKEESLFGIRIVSLPFFNPLLVKHAFRYHSLCSVLSKFDTQFREASILFIYELDTVFLSFAEQVKKKYPHIKIVNIIPDLIGFTGAKETVLSKFLFRNTWDSVRAKLPAIDFFVYLAEPMKEYLGVDTPYMVIEGIYNMAEETKLAALDMINSKMNRLFYAGAMSRRNGVSVLLEAMSLIPDSNYELILCGDGELHDEIITLVANDSRIKFMGNLPHDKVLQLQKECSLLINPRPALEEFTKYSFPSKTMEYYASATPVLMFRLPGTPSEYYQYCYCLEEFSAEHFANKIKEICHLPLSERREMGKRARHYILSKKIPKMSVNLLINRLMETFG